MVNPLVERATSDMLIGPDWAMNIEICDILNHNPGQVRDVVKGIKKRLGSKNPKVQLLALTLLETLIKNCGDIVHMHVADRDILHEMVKIVKKKPDFHVKEKILTLIDTWQEAFGGPRARYPQYFAAYHELLRAGAVFPQKYEKATPALTHPGPPQTRPLSSYPQNMRKSDHQHEAPESSADSEFPTLSLIEIQNVRSIMDVLAEMLNALDPGSKEAIRQEVIVDLVGQCRTYKQRVVHLVNSTSDESLLCQGLALNDDLQCLLAKHESIASGTYVKAEKPKPLQASLVDIDGLAVTSSTQPDGRSASSPNAGNQPPPVQVPASNGPVTPSAKVAPEMDLLSGDLYNSPMAENSLALVPVGEPQPASPVLQQTASPSQQNILALSDMFPNSVDSTNSNPAYPAGQAYSSTEQVPQQQPLQCPQPTFYSNGSTPNMGLPQSPRAPWNNQVAQGFNHHQEQPMGLPQPPHANAPWNNQVAQGFNHQLEQPMGLPQSPCVNASWNHQVAQGFNHLQEQPIYGLGAQSNGALPPPPWETQPTESRQLSGTFYPQQMQVTQVVVTHSQPIQSGTPSHFMGSGLLGMYIQPITTGQLGVINHQPFQDNQMLGIHPQPIQGGQVMGMLPPPMQTGQPESTTLQPMHNNLNYGYGTQPQFLEQKMHELSVQDEGALTNSSYLVGSTASTTTSYLPPMKPSRPEDKLFGDLVDLAKTKPTKPTSG